MTEFQPQIDLTLVVNIHDGTSYLNRTMLSLEEAARYALPFGVRCELLFVMDRSPPEAIAWVAAYQSDAFVSRRVIEVDNGSLGLSRNDGLLAARGEIVLFCDEDDLISYNMASEFYFLAKSAGPNNVVVPEYFLAFGREFYAYRYFGTGTYSPLLFIADHPFTSRICIHRSVAEQVRYSDVRLTKGFAYEDYHFNSQLAARNFTFTVAPNTIVFYREKSQSLLQSMRAISTKQIPPTPLFEPSSYLSACTADYLRREELETKYRKLRTSAAEYFSNRTCLELTRAANAIDPGIDISRAVHAGGGTNLAGALAPGIAYYRACKNIGEMQFTDVVLLPFLTKGGGEKYILNVINAIQEIDADARFLILAGQPFWRHSWLDRLPSNGIFLDIPSLYADLTDEHIDVVTLRLIIAAAPSARVHIKTSPYGHRFVEKFGKLLTGNKLYYYRFCDGCVQIDGAEFTQGYSFNFLSENSNALHCIMADNRRIYEHDTSRIDVGSEKWKLLYTPVEPLTHRKRIKQRGSIFRRKLVWTSRLDRQKKPELLCAIAARLHVSAPDITIDVYGSPTLDAFDVTLFQRHPNINYRGDYERFDAIPHDDYDALIYLTAFDGLPISLLDAFSAGLPVIAPDIGGIGEVVVNGETGILIQNTSDEELVGAYVAAVDLLYSDADTFLRFRRNALKLIESRHSHDGFLKQVSEIFQL